MYLLQTFYKRVQNTFAPKGTVADSCSVHIFLPILPVAGSFHMDISFSSG